MIQDLFTFQVFERVSLQPVPPMGDKWQRASGWVTRARTGGFFMCPAMQQWDMQGFVDEAIVFNGLGLTHDDRIDAVSGGYGLLWWIRGDTQQKQSEPALNTSKYYERLEETQGEEHGARLRELGFDLDD
jgi:hypothetical protein